MSSEVSFLTFGAFCDIVFLAYAVSINFCIKKAIPFKG